jgi:hypothetical protein
MSKESNVLGGFTAAIDMLNPGYIPNQQEPVDPVDPNTQVISNEDELDELFELAKTTQSVKPTSNTTIQKDDEDEPTQVVDLEESEYITSLFDVFTERKGITGIEDDEKPKSIEDFIEYINALIEEESKPAYSNEMIAELDEFIRNGGSIQDYFSVNNTVDYDSLDLAKESNQRLIVTELLKRQGLNDTQIQRKLDKYEDAGILEDEAEEAKDLLQETIKKEKQFLLEQQNKARIEAEQQRETFYNNIIKTVESLNDIRGIAISKAEKRELLEYMFKQTKSGQTKYQEDYANSLDNLVESAYFTKNKDKLIKAAKQAGAVSAVDKFRQKLKQTDPKMRSKATRTGSGKAIWEML